MFREQMAAMSQIDRGYRQVISGSVVSIQPCIRPRSAELELAHRENTLLRQPLKWLGGPGLPERETPASDQRVEDVAEEDEPTGECEEDLDTSEEAEDSA